MPPPITPIPGLPTIYVPFAQPGPIQITPNMAYRAFVQPASNYRAFAPSSVVYADFAARRPVKPRGRPLDLRVNVGLEGVGRALVMPTGVIVKPGAKAIATKPLVQRPHGESG